MSGKSLQQTTSADNFLDAFSERFRGKEAGPKIYNRVKILFMRAWINSLWNYY